MQARGAVGAAPHDRRRPRLARRRGRVEVTSPTCAPHATEGRDASAWTSAGARSDHPPDRGRAAREKAATAQGDETGETPGGGLATPAFSTTSAKVSMRCVSHIPTLASCRMISRAFSAGMALR